MLLAGTPPAAEKMPPTMSSPLYTASAPIVTTPLLAVKPEAKGRQDVPFQAESAVPAGTAGSVKPAPTINSELKVVAAAGSREKPGPSARQAAPSHRAAALAPRLPAVVKVP